MSEEIILKASTLLDFYEVSSMVNKLPEIVTGGILTPAPRVA
jgi:hypothetical protein